MSFHPTFQASTHSIRCFEQKLAEKVRNLPIWTSELVKYRFFQFSWLLKMSIFRFITTISYVNQDLFQSLAGSKVKSGQVSDKNGYSEGEASMCIIGVAF